MNIQWTDHLRIIGTLMIIATQFSCSDNPTGNTQRISPLGSMVPGAPTAGDTLIGLFELAKTRMTLLDSSGEVEVLSTYSLAAFLDTMNFDYTMAGVCVINGDTLAQSDASQTYWSDSATIALSGDANIFSISGASSVPAISDSLESTSDATFIYSPETGDTLSRNSNLTISWNSGGADTVHVFIMGKDTSGNSGRVDYTVPNNGSYTISASSLARFATGSELVIAVARLNYKKIPQPNSRQMLILVHSDHLIFCQLQ